MLGTLQRTPSQETSAVVHSCIRYDSAEPPAKRARTSKSPGPTCTPAATFDAPPSSAFTIPTSSEQAVARSLSAPPADDAGDEEHAGNVHAEHADGADETDPERALTPPPPTAGSDFDDLDWDWLDKSDELERAQPKSTVRDKGKGKALPPPPADSGRIRHLHTATPRAAAPLPAQIPQQVFFQTASHKKISVSDTALKEAQRRLEAWEAEDVPGPSEPSPPASTTAVTKPAAPKPSPFKTPRVVSARIMPGTQRAPASVLNAPASPGPARVHSPRLPAAGAHTKTPLPERVRDLHTPAPAMRTPLAATETPVQMLHNRATRSASPDKSIRPDQGLTPRPAAANSLRRSARPRFSTPFKKEPRHTMAHGTPAHAPEPSVVASAATPQRIYPTLTAATTTSAGFAAPSAQAGPSHRPVFDMCPPVQARSTLSTFGIVPESVSAAQAQSRGAPSEILVILKHPDLARHYVFDDASMPNQSLGPAAALKMLRDAAGEGSAAYSEECLNLRWVQNHWGLILWKLAALVRHKPEEVFRLWTWAEMCRQLRYRYEREINRAERSAVKRIQEHDASASAPIVLCVRAILSGAPFWSKDAAEGSPSRNTETAAYTLELTDGWYRIRASVDMALGRAIERKRIKAGVKLAIRGARLHSGNEGCHVLDALEKSGLSLNGNSTSLARWDSRLGFSKCNFTSSLRSLGADGGCVACMDVILTKVHPRGYIDVKNGSGTGSTSNARSEAEEAEAASRWQAAYAEAQETVQADIESKAERWQEVKELVAEWAERLCSGGDLGNDVNRHGDIAAEDLIQKLLSSKEPRLVLKEAVDANPPLSSIISRVQTLVQEGAKTEQSEAVEQAQQKLAELCPPRKVRSFQVIRFRDAVDDATLPATSKLRKSKRTVQVTVWDAAELSETTELVEGERYEVTNLQPIFKSSWKSADAAADIFLCTRRNTMWRRVM